MDTSREVLYEQLRHQIGHTPLYEIKNIPVPNQNRIFVKEEYRNPTGSHYDRVFLKLLYNLEKNGIISPGQALVETTSGNAGASFAWLCHALGYKATVLIPEDMPASRIAQIKSFGTQLEFSPKGEYVVGVIAHLRDYLIKQRSQGNSVYCTNHAESEYSVQGMEDGAKEVIEDLEHIGINTLDFCLSALGGGIHVLGYANVLLAHWPNMKLIGIEPFEAPENYLKRFPGRFEATYGIVPHLSPHGLLGIGRWGSTKYTFPHIQKALPLLNDILLITTEQWQTMSQILMDSEAKFVGRTSAASLCGALQLAEQVHDKTFLITFYDPSWKYLNGVSIK